MLGFLIFAGGAMAILAAIVLLPEYARLANSLHQRDCEDARTLHLEKANSVQERMYQAAQDDPIFIANIAVSRGESRLSDRTAVATEGNASPPPGTIQVSPTPLPPAPNDKWIEAAAKVSDPGTRRGLCLVAGGLMLAAIFLFGPPTPRKPSPPPHGDAASRP